MQRNFFFGGGGGKGGGLLPGDVLLRVRVRVQLTRKIVLVVFLLFCRMYITFLYTRRSCTLMMLSLYRFRLQFDNH